MSSHDAALEADVRGPLAGLQERLAAYFAGRVTDPVVRQDLVSRVNERVLKRSRDGTVIDDVERFAFGVARHVLQEHWREVKRRQAVEVTLSATVENRPKTAVTATSTSSSPRAALLHALRECIEELPDTDRLIARRCYGEGKSKDLRAAIAEELQLSRNALDARLSRIRARLEACVRARLGAGEDESGNPSEQGKSIPR